MDPETLKAVGAVGGTNVLLVAGAVAYLLKRNGNGTYVRADVCKLHRKAETEAHERMEKALDEMQAELKELTRRPPAA